MPENDLYLLLLDQFYYCEDCEETMTTIYYVGYGAAHPGDFLYDFPEGHDFWLLILTHTPAEIWVQGSVKEYPAHCAVLFRPGQKIWYRACVEQFVNDWVRFDTDESYLTETTLPLGLPLPLIDPGYFSRLFQLLATEHFFQYDYRELSIDYLLRLMFHKLLEAARETDRQPDEHQLLELRKRIHNNPGFAWSVPVMAESVHLSPSYLQALYKSAFGVSCMEDVIQSRVRLAKERLIYGSQRIADIATLCGYRNVEHFSRQFRQIAGCTPRAFRSSAGAAAEQT